jgi:hypothetical protein
MPQPLPPVATPVASPEPAPPAPVDEPVTAVVSVPPTPAVPVAAPVVETEPTAATPAVQTLAVDLSATLNQVGLVMIETAGNTPQQANAALEQPQALGRKPKAPAVVAQEPLQMVETRHDR